MDLVGFNRILLVIDLLITLVLETYEQIFKDLERNSFQICIKSHSYSYL